MSKEYTKFAGGFNFFNNTRYEELITGYANSSSDWFPYILIPGTEEDIRRYQVNHMVWTVSGSTQQETNDVFDKIQEINKDVSLSKYMSGSFSRSIYHESAFLTTTLNHSLNDGEYFDELESSANFDEEDLFHFALNTHFNGGVDEFEGSSLEQRRASWSNSSEDSKLRFLFDMSRPESRAKLINNAIEMVLRWNNEYADEGNYFNSISFDNCGNSEAIDSNVYSLYKNKSFNITENDLAGSVDWDEAWKLFYQEAIEAIHNVGLKVIFNIGCTPDIATVIMNWFSSLEDKADGVMFESQIWHPRFICNSDAYFPSSYPYGGYQLEKQIQAARAMVAAGTSLYAFNVIRTSETVGVVDVNSFYNSEEWNAGNGWSISNGTAIYNHTESAGQLTFLSDVEIEVGGNYQIWIAVSGSGWDGTAELVVSLGGVEVARIKGNTSNGRYVVFPTIDNSPLQFKVENSVDGLQINITKYSTSHTELRIPATFPIVHHKYFIGERELFGYSPLYQPNTVTFDINNRPTIRVGNIIQSLTGNSWTENNWYTAARRVFAGWRYAVQTGPFTDERVVFDSDGWAYTIINNYYHNRPNTPWEARLLYSPDYCVSSTPTWKGLYLGEGKARIEFNDSGNLSDYPPAVLRWSRPYPDPTPAVDTLHLDVLSKNGQTLIISDSTVITTIWMGGYQAGGGNWSVSTGSKIHIVYPENDGQSNGTPQYAVTYNRSSRTLSSPFLLGYGATGDPGNPPDRHCVPAITVDRDGYLHVILGAHNRPLQYRKSLAANSTAGWSDVEDIGLASVNSGYKNVFTYVSLICGNNNSIHVVARASGHGGPIHTGKHFLVYFRKKENHSWEVLNELVIPFKTNYSNYYHNLNIDRKGRLFLSYMYFANWMLQSEIAAYRAKWPTEIITLNMNKIDKTDPAGWRYDCRGAKPHDPVILMSDDGGDTWKLVTTGDFVEGLQINITKYSTSHIVSARVSSFPLQEGVEGLTVHQHDSSYVPAATYFDARRNRYGRHELFAKLTNYVMVEAGNSQAGSYWSISAPPSFDCFHILDREKHSPVLWRCLPSLPFYLYYCPLDQDWDCWFYNYFNGFMYEWARITHSVTIPVDEFDIPINNGAVYSHSSNSPINVVSLDIVRKAVKTVRLVNENKDQSDLECVIALKLHPYHYEHEEDTESAFLNKKIDDILLAIDNANAYWDSLIGGSDLYIPGGVAAVGAIIFEGDKEEGEEDFNTIEHNVLARLNSVYNIHFSSDKVVWTVKNEEVDVIQIMKPYDSSFVDAAFSSLDVSAAVRVACITFARAEHDDELVDFLDYDKSYSYLLGKKIKDCSLSTYPINAVVLVGSPLNTRNEWVKNAMPWKSVLSSRSGVYPQEIDVTDKTTWYPRYDFIDHFEAFVLGVVANDEVPPSLPAVSKKERDLVPKSPDVTVQTKEGHNWNVAQGISKYFL